jgi:DNA-binding NtrC family response regulator
VRELENIIERAVVMSNNTVLTLQDLPPEVQQATPGRTDVPQIPGASLADIERHAILSTLEMVGGSTTAAARVLGISVRKIQYRLQEYAEAPKGKVPAVQSRDQTSTQSS